MIRFLALLCCLPLLAHTASAAAQTTVSAPLLAELASGSDAVGLTLAGANALLLERNRELRAAQRRIEGARADVIIAGQRPNPVLSVGASTPFRTEMSNRVMASGVGARLDQLIERGNKRELRVALAEQSLSASDADLDDTRRVQRLLLAATFYALKRAEQRVQVNRQTESLLERLVAAMELRLKAGDIAPSELARVRVELLRARNDTVEADAERRQAQADLGFLLGVEAAASRLRSDEPWPDLIDPQQPLQAGIELEARADVRAAQFRLAAAERARDLARSLRTRDIVVSAGVDRAMPESGASFPSVGVAIPIFAWHRFEGEQRRAETEVFAAQDELERVRASAQTEITRARGALVNAALRTARYRNELLGQAERSANAIEFAYRNGALGLIDLLDARRTLQATRLDATDAEADYARARAAWRAVTQAAGDLRAGDVR
jgi:outer membrane protein, heavy metal efflux system